MKEKQGKGKFSFVPQSERRRGFYLAGMFWKGQKAKFALLSQKEKPFEIDKVEGRVYGKVLQGFKRNFEVREWHFFEGFTLSDLNKNNDLRAYLNEVWGWWCKKYKRKYTPIMLPLEVDS